MTTIIPIAGTDLISNAPTALNTNFNALNSGKIESTLTTFTPSVSDAVAVYDVGTSTWKQSLISSLPTSGTGTVTSVAVPTANGFYSTVTDPTNAVSIELKVNVTGIIKGDGTAMSSAIAGTDYLAPASAASISGLFAYSTSPTVPTPTTSTQAVNKSYVDSVAVPTGAISMWSTNSAPPGFLMCDGTAVSRTTYATLFSVVGTTYGAGDGSTTFNIPNMVGRVPVGRDSGQTEFDTLGETGGAKTHTLTISEMPAHTHTGAALVASNSNAGNVGSGVNATTDTGSQGGGAAHNNLQPYIVLNYIIKT